MLATLQLLLPSLAAALPSDGKVVGGHATIQHTNPNTLDIHQSTDKAIINWQSFSIGGHESVRFAQPSVNSIALNRVVGVDPSVILGQLQANGRIFLINPNGILFGAGAQINVGGLLATTLQIRDEDFMAGRFLFAQDPLKGLRSVINHGTIRVSDHGFVFLVAPGVANDGLIVANLGKVVLGSGQQLTLDLMGDGLINYAINGKVLDHVTGMDGKPLSSAVSNSGTIQADGGQVILSAKASGDIFSSVVNQSGVIRAKSLVNHGGSVRLEGSDSVANTGTVGWQANLGQVKNADGAVLNTGTIDVSAAQPGAAQGQVTVTGQNVGVAGNILARGAEWAQGGQVLISSTKNTVVTGNSVIDTSGSGHSSAGNAVIWSDGNTQFGGQIQATGGSLAGDGGHVEVSGHRNLAFTGQVDTQAPNGTMGTLLLDPTNITVATGGTATAAQVDQFADPDCAAGGCTISPTTINANANITLQANNDITVSNAIAKTNSGRTLTMQAGRNITLNANVSTTNAAISMTANDAAAGAGRAAGAGSISGAGNVSSGNGAINLTLGTNAGGAGSINLTGTVTSSGTTTINAGAANNATLNNGANNFGTVAVASGNNVTVSDTNALVLGTSTVSGNLNVTTGGAVTQSGALAVTGSTTVAAGANNITLTNAANDFSTVGITSGNNVALRDANALDLAASTVGGTLGVTTAGAITQSGALNVSGTTTLAAGATNDITLNNAGNVFGTVGITNANNVTLQDSTALNLAASTVSGALNVTANGAITDSGNLVVTGTTTLAAGAANNITLNNTNNFSTVSITSGNNVTLVDSNAIDLGASTISGTLGITSAGAITQSGALNVAGTTILAAGAANNITLNNAGNVFGTVGITNANNVTLQDSTALTLAASTVSGTLGVTTNGALTQSGALTVAGVTTLAAGTANDITLNNAANNFSTVGITNGNNVSLRDTNALILGVSTISGAFDVTTNGALTQSGALTVAGATTLAAGAANNITLNNAGNVFGTVGITNANNVTLQDSTALNLAASTVSGTLGVTTNGALTQSGALTVAGVTTLAAGAANNITLNNAANNFSTVGITNGNNVALVDSNALVLGTSAVSGTLGVTTNGALTQSGALTVAGVTTLAAGAANNITLNNAANNFSTVGITNGNNVALVDSNALVLGTSAVSGTLGVTTNGALTQSGALTVAGVTTLAAGAANNITLNNAANNFSTVGITTGNNVALTDANALTLAASTVSGTLGVTTNGALTQSGALTVAGVTTLAAGAANDITLNNAANNFSTVGITTGNNVALTDANALTLAASTVSGTLGVTTNGALTQSGALTVAGATTLAAGAANNITLNNAANNFSTVGITTGNNVALTDANALTLAASTVSGTLGVTTNGALTQSGALTVAGVTTLAAGTANDITLNNAANNFSTVGITNGNNVSLRDTNALILGVSTISGAFDVTTNGALTQSGALTVAGATTLAAGAANNITLNNAGNVFGTVGITNANNVTLQDSTALNLAASTVSGTLGVTTNGALTQSGALTVAGVTTLAAGAANNITLNNAANNFSTVGITNGNNVALVDSNALVLGTSAVSGTLGVTTNGALTQSGALTVAGVTTLAAGAANNITLNNAANNFSTVGITNGNNVTLTDANVLNLAASTVSGTLALTTGGVLTQSGALAVTGTTSFTATAAASDILLDTQANSFGGTLSFAGTQANFRDVQLRNISASATVPTLAGLTNLRNLTLTFNNAAVALPAVTLTGGGNLTVTAGGAITDTGNVVVPGTTTLTAGTNNITLDNANNFTGSVSIVSGNNVTLNDINALDLGTSTVNGTLGVTTAGAITQSGALNVAGITTLAAGAANNITLNNAANNFSTVGITNGNNVALTDANALSLGTSTVSGTFNVTTNGALTQSGPLVVTGSTTLAAGAANDITLNNAANNFSTASITSGNNVALADANALILGASTVSGTLGVTTAGAITQSGALNVAGVTTLAAGAANNITLNNAANNFTTVGITTGNNVALTDANALDLGTSTISGTFNVAANGVVTQSGALNVTGATTLAAGAANNIVLNNAANNFSTIGITTGNNVTLRDANALILGSSTIGGTFDVTTNGALTQSGPLNVGGTTTLAAGSANNIVLTNAANNFSTVGITSGNNVALTDSAALTLAASTVSGTLDVTTGGTLSQSGALTVTGTTTLTATAANSDVLLGTQANNLGGAFSFAGTQANFRDVSLRNVNAGATVPTLAGLTNLRNLTLTFDNAPITLPTLTLTAGGNLTATAGGMIAQSGALTVPGTMTLATTVAGSDILLNTHANNITGAVTLGGTTSNIRDLGLRNLNAGATMPTLAGLTNLRNLTLTFDNAPITVPTLAASGAVNLTAGGSITQSGTMTVGGTTTLATTVAGSDILLNTQPNNFTGAIAFGGTTSNIRDLSLRNVNAGASVPTLAGLTNLRNLTLTFNSAPVALPALTLTGGGNLTVTAGGGITDTGNLVIPGTTTLTAGVNDITLDNANNFTGPVSIVSGNNVTLTDINALTLGASTINGTLGVTTTGALTQSGALNVAGTTTLAAGAGNDITLTNAGNDFSTVAITSGHNVALTDSNALVLGASTVSGTLGLTAGGPLSQSGVLNVTGVTTFTATTTNTDVLLATQANDFGSAIVFGGTQSNLRDVRLRNVNAGASVPTLAGLTNLRNLTLTFDNAPISLPALTASGNLTLTAGGTIAQSGAVAVGGATTLATTVAGSDILLDTQPNNFTGAMAFGGTTSNIRDLGLRNVNAGASVPTLAGLTNLRNLTLTFDNTPISLPALALTAGGNLSVTAGGTITQSGALTVPGTTTLATTVAGADILLDTQPNNFTGAMAFGGTTSNIRDLGLRNVNAGASVPTLAGLTNLRNLTLTFDNAPISLPTLTASGNLAVTAGGAISQTGTLIIPGTTTLTAGANDITLTNAGNDFSTVAITSGNTVALTDANALVLGASTINGTLGVTTNGALTQSGALNVAGTTTLAAGAGNDITLTNAGNDFSTVAITSGNTVALTDANALVLGASTINGTLGVTTNGALTQSGALNVAGTTTLAAGAGNDITLTNAANDFSTVAITSGNNVALTDSNALDLGASTINGTLGVSTTGALTQTGPLNVTGATTLAAGAANDITLTNAANDFSTVAVTSGNNVALTDSTALDLGTSTVSGNLAVTAGGAISQTGALTVGGAAGFDTTAAATLGSVTLANGAALTLHTSTVGGNLTATTTAGDLTLPAGHTLTVVGDATLTPAGNVTLLGTTQIGGTQASIGGTGSSFVLGADTNLNALPLPGTGNITVTTTGTTATFAGPPLLPSAITLGNTANQFGGPVSVTTAAPAFTGSTTATHNLTQSAPVTLNVGQSLTVTDLGGTAGTRGNITLTNTANSFETVTFTGGNIAWAETGPVTIGGVSANAGATSTGTLAVTATGPLTQTGAILAAGPTTLAAGAANDITLTNAGNDFSTVAITSGRNVALTDINALTLGASTISGTLGVSTTGALTQTGPLNVTGATTLAAGAANDITLTNAGNDFSTVAITSGNTVALTDANALVLGASTINGTLGVTTNGALTQSGALNVAGTTTLAAGAGNDITLTNAANDFSTVAITSGNTVALTDSNALVLGASTINGTLGVTTNGALTQSGALNVAGTTTLAAGAANDITLTNAANDFSTVAITSGNNVALTDSNALDLGASTINGTLGVSTTGALTQTGPLTVTGATTLAAGAANDITLTNAGNDFSTVAVTSGNNVALTDSTALDLGTSTVSGTLGVTTTGALTQTGPLTVTGATTLAAGAGNDITLTNAGNDFSTVAITSGNNVALTDANALILGTSTISGNLSTNAADLTIAGAVASTGGTLSLAATNSVTQLAALTTNGANGTTVSAGGPITMAAAATTTSTTGSLDYTAGTDVTLGSLNTGGSVSVIANGGSVFSAVGSGTNVTAGANSTLQALNGVVGTQTAPVRVNINPGTLSIRATGAVSGISAFLMGAVLPGNALTLLNVPPGTVCFNSCPLPPNNDPLAGVRGIIPSFNVQSVIPWYRQQPSDPPMISVFSTYVPQSVLTEKQVNVQGTGQSIRREVTPCFPLSSCSPPATTLSAPVGKEGAAAR
ncbi:hypothetical protein [Nitrospira japonica]|uniref:hypothetical protein n=1 Tax=Nitrospira japonica TaxID=1325564 RepID=UPI0009BB3940|nr:hypothetical protein [Nitrospira japonica]